MYKLNNATLFFNLATLGNTIESSGDYLYLIAGATPFHVRKTGHLKLPTISTQPSHGGMSGSFIYGNNWMHVVSDSEDIFKLDVSGGW